MTASCSGPAKPPSTASQDAIHLRGAGATFPAPLYHKWFYEYGKLHPEVKVDYDAVGSGFGIGEFTAGRVDFGASDAAMTDEEIAKVAGGVQLVPMTAGSVVVAYNLPEIGGDLKLARDVYPAVFLGEIRAWNDPRIAAANPGLKLPDLPITVVVRGDSSGTTFAMTNHLSAVSQPWKQQVGVGKWIEWPGKATKVGGNAGVTRTVKGVPGAIGYVEFGYAWKADLKMAWLENRAGRFIEPTAGSGTAALASAKLPENLRAFVPDPEGDDSYPIVTFSWLLLRKESGAPEKAATLRNLLQWCLADGQTYSAELGYLPLAPAVIEAARKAVGAIGP